VAAVAAGMAVEEVKDEPDMYLYIYIYLYINLSSYISIFLSIFV